MADAPKSIAEIIAGLSESAKRGIRDGFASLQGNLFQHLLQGTVERPLTVQAQTVAVAGPVKTAQPGEGEKGGGEGKAKDRPPPSFRHPDFAAGSVAPQQLQGLFQGLTEVLGPLIGSLRNAHHVITEGIKPVKGKADKAKDVLSTAAGLRANVQNIYQSLSQMLTGSGPAVSPASPVVAKAAAAAAIAPVSPVGNIASGVQYVYQNLAQTLTAPDPNSGEAIANQAAFRALHPGPVDPDSGEAIANAAAAAAGNIAKTVAPTAAATGAGGTAGAAPAAASAIAALSTNPIGWAVEAGVAVAAVAVALNTLPFLLKDFGKSVLETNRGLANVSASMAAVFARYDADNLLLNLEKGQRLSGSAGALAESLSALNQGTKEVEIAFGHVTNLLGTAAANLGTGLTQVPLSTFSGNPATMAIDYLLEKLKIPGFGATLQDIARGINQMVENTVNPDDDNITVGEAMLDIANATRGQRLTDPYFRRPQY